MSWEEEFRRNIERTRQRILEIAPDMLDLKAHHSAAGRPPPRAGAQPMPGEGTRPPTASELPFASRFRTTIDTTRTQPSSTPLQDPFRRGISSAIAPLKSLPAPPSAWSGNTGRCGGIDCLTKWYTSAPLTGFGTFSQNSRTLPVFSYSTWMYGYLGRADCAVIRAVAWAINQTSKGDEVLISMTAWYVAAWEILNAVVAARNRGVQIRVITGSGKGGPNAEWANADNDIKPILTSALGANYRDWDNGAPFYNINHNKFILIRRGSQSFVTAVTSANWASFDISRNCDLLFVDSPAIYFGFRQYWQALWDSMDSGVASYSSYWKDPKTGVTARFWPSLPIGDNADHPYVQVLESLKKGPGTIIRVIGAAWSTSKAGTVAEQLVEHSNAGSDVRVAGNHHLDRGCHRVEGCPKTPGAGTCGEGFCVGSCETKDNVWVKLTDAGVPWVKIASHAKVLMIAGKVDGVMRRSVYTGSLNMTTQKSMPDAFVGIHDDPVLWNQYESWFLWLCNNTRFLASNSPCRRSDIFGI